MLALILWSQSDKTFRKKSAVLLGWLFFSFFWTEWKGVGKEIFSFLF